jgi:hypothetical protein
MGWGELPALMLVVSGMEMKNAGGKRRRFYQRLLFDTGGHC